MRITLTESQLFGMIKDIIMESLACMGANYYNVRKLAHDVKNGDSDAIEQAAIMMAKKVPAKSVLIPVPNHSGKAEYTLKLAQRIAQLSNSTAIDILSAKPRSGHLYTVKMKNKGIAPEYDLGFTTSKDENTENILKSARNIILIDNVVDSGMTYQQAENAIRKTYGVNPWMLSLGVVSNPKDTSRNIVRSTY